MSHLMSTSPPIVTSFIDGAFVAPAGLPLEIIDPATEEVGALLHEADAAEVDRAVRSARRSFEQGAWSRATVAHRQAVLTRFLSAFEREIDALAAMEVRTTGLPWTAVRQRQLPRVGRNLKFFCELIGQNVERSVLQDGAYMRWVLREPAGVAALISPWNAPIALASTKIAAALAFGNSCVVKTSEQTPTGIARFVELLHEAGVPPGVVNLVNGRGGVTGSALVSHPDVRLVSFTGGTETGREIAGTAGRLLKRVDVELGGKSACIVTQHADLDVAVPGALASIFSNNGAQCFAGSRILVQRGIAQAFIERFIEGARAMRLGDPMDPATTIGPMITAAHRQRVLGYLEAAHAEGCTLLTGGRVPADQPRGYWIEPTAVLAPNNHVRVCREEIFAPFATILMFDTLDEAIAIANDSRFGLAGYLYTTDLDEAMWISERIECGLMNVNTPLVHDLRFPLGGYRDSGVSREGAEGSRAFYTEEKSVAMALRSPKRN